jgi:intracellular sulfur oxidation DsrE/DsrF family protein
MEGYYQDQKVVYQNNGAAAGDPGYFKRLLTNIANHIAAVGRNHIEIRVVVFASGIDLFQAVTTDESLAEDYDALHAQGVRFLICANSLKSRGLDWPALRRATKDDIVPSGVAELARLQSMGFLYIHP